MNLKFSCLFFFTCIIICVLLCLAKMYKLKTNNNIIRCIINNEKRYIISKNNKDIKIIRTNHYVNREGNKKVYDIIIKFPINLIDISLFHKIDDELSELLINEKLLKNDFYEPLYPILSKSDIIILKEDDNFTTFPIILIYENEIYWIYEYYRID